MHRFNFRKKPRISYYELDEPAFDEYMFCEYCGDYVYEYCSVHGALLVVPDDKVPVNPDVPPYVPRAALTIPHVFLHLARSYIPGAGIGVFTTLTLPSGVQFGPYCGQRRLTADSDYCWQIYDKNNKPSHVVDAADANCSNWMRYVNCARHWHEQNMVAFQYRGQLYYRTIKLIPRFTELLVFYGSEFAHNLNIDLRNYNSPSGLSRKFDQFRAIINTRPEKVPEIEINELSNDTATSGLKDVEVNNDNLFITEFNIIDSPEFETSNTKVTVDVGVNTDWSMLNDYDNKINTNVKKRRYEETFSCNVCGYKSHVLTGFEKHQMLHDMTRKHACDICGYRFVCPSKLRKHYTCHGTNRPFAGF